MPGDDKTISITTKLKDELSKSVRRMVAGVSRDFGSLATGGVKRLTSGFVTLIRTGLKLTGILGAVGAALSAVGGAFALRGLIAGIKSTASEISELSLQAQSLGLSATFVFEMSSAFEALGASATEAFAAVAVGRQNILRFAQRGTGPAAEAVAKLGLRVRDANGELRRMDDLLPEIARGLGKLDDFERVRIGRELFGTSDPRQLGILTGAVGELARARDDVRAIGGSITDEQVERLDLLNRSIRRFGIAYAGLFRGLSAEIAPLGKRVVDAATAIVAALPDAFGKLVENVEALFGDDGAVRDRLAAQFESLEDSTVTLVRRLAFVIGDAVAQYGNAALSAAFASITQSSGPDLAAVIVETFGNTLSVIEKGIGDFIANSPHQNRVPAGVARFLQNYAEVTQQEYQAIAENIALSNTGSGFVIFAEEFERGLQEVSISTLGVGDAARAVTRDVEALTGIFSGTKRVLSSLRDEIKKADDEAQNASFFQQLAEGAAGFVTGINNITERYRNASQAGVAFGETVAGSFSQNLFPALESVIEKTKSVGEAFKDLARLVVRSVAEVATQILALRLITGIGRIFTASAPLDANGLAAAGSQGSFLSGFPTFARGGAVAGGRLFNAARGFVQSPVSGGQLVRIGEAGGSEAVLPLTTGRDGSLGVRAQMSGGGVTIAPTINVTVSGDARDPGGLADRIGAEVAARILDLISRTPALRRQLAGMPRGAL